MGPGRTGAHAPAGTKRTQPLTHTASAVPGEVGTGRRSRAGPPRRRAGLRRGPEAGKHMDTRGGRRHLCPTVGRGARLRRPQETRADLAAGIGLGSF